MGTALQSVTSDGKQYKGIKPLLLEQPPFVKVCGSSSTDLHGKVKSESFFSLWISLTLRKMFLKSPLLTSELAQGTISTCCAYFLLGCKDSVLISFPSQKNWQRRETQKHITKCCCASHKPIIKHRFDSIIHVLW